MRWIADFSAMSNHTLSVVGGTIGQKMATVKRLRKLMNAIALLATGLLRRPLTEPDAGALSILIDEHDTGGEKWVRFVHGVAPLEDVEKLAAPEAAFERCTIVSSRSLSLLCGGLLSRRLAAFAHPRFQRRARSV
jgi:hypothetical protein